MASLSTFEPLIMVIHFLAAFVLVVSILLQPGKGAGLGAAFGMGSSDTLFGAQGSTGFLRKVTIVGALVFLATSLSLAFAARDQSGGAESVVDQFQDKVQDKAVLPETPTEAPKVETTPVVPAEVPPAAGEAAPAPQP